jgi:hypothetical protein
MPVGSFQSHFCDSREEGPEPAEGARARAVLQALVAAGAGCAGGMRPSAFQLLALGSRAGGAHKASRLSCPKACTLHPVPANALHDTILGGSCTCDKPTKLLTRPAVCTPSAREPPREAHTFTSSSSAGGSDGIAPARANQSEVGKRRRRPSVRAGTLQAAAAVVSTLPAPPQLGASGAPAAATKLASLSLESQAASKQPQELHQAGRKRLRNSSAASDAAEDPDWQPGALKVGPPPTKRSRRITRPPARL